MARQRSPDRDKAKDMYLKSKGEMLLKDIAEKLGLKDSQIRKWKSQDKWDDELKGALPKTKGNVTIHKDKVTPNKEKEIMKELEDADLTEKQRLFCLYYVKSFNATMAAIKAGYSSDSAHVEGSRLLRNVKVAAEIRRLKGAMQEEIFIDAMDVLNKYIKIAFADINDYLCFGQREVPVMGPFGPLYEGKGKNKKPITKIVNYIDFKESNIVDGSIISEVKQGKDGASIKLADKMKAMEKLEKYFDLFPDQFKRRIEEEKIQIQKQKLDIDGKDKTVKVVIVDNIPEDDEDVTG
ncbi:terminase small subunit [Anaerosolibacter sp.]|uniref:terminase small subunit n=1 Tax=Anaerosolibacter sp. TaxID=1872527 RepID=UPI0039F0CADA